MVCIEDCESHNNYLYLAGTKVRKYKSYKDNKFIRTILLKLRILVKINDDYVIN